MLINDDKLDRKLCEALSEDEVRLNVGPHFITIFRSADSWLVTFMEDRDGGRSARLFSAQRTTDFVIVMALVREFIHRVEGPIANELSNTWDYPNYAATA